MKTQISFLLLASQALVSLALVVKSPDKKATESLIEQRQDMGGVKLMPYNARKHGHPNKHQTHMHMLAKDPAPVTERPVKDCIACFGVQVVYGKYQTEDGDQTANSYYMFKDPVHKKGDDALPLIIQFHAGGFTSGKPSTLENNEIRAYLEKGFAFASVGYRLVTQKYNYLAKDGDNKTEELIHVAKDGKLSLDSTGKTMEDYKVRVGKQEHMTKYLYDATQMMEHLIENAEKFGVDINNIVFVGESTGGAAMQYLSWIYHKRNQGRFTPRGMVLHNSQLNYPVHNMLSETWDLFAESMGPQTKLADVVSAEACPTIVGNHLCGSENNASDYKLCNEEWNERSLREFCGEALESATLGQIQKRQVWPKEEKEEHGQGMEKLWYSAENMQQHMPSEPFYIYAANSMNGTGPVDVAHHSIFALNFARFAEMGKHGGHQYTVYYTDFAHMTDADRGMERLEATPTAADLGLAASQGLPPVAGSPGLAPAAVIAASPVMALQTGRAPGPAPAPAPAPAPSPMVATGTVYNYLSTHEWRKDSAVEDVQPGSLDERVLYACLAAKVGPFREFAIKDNTTTLESGALATSVSGVGLIAVIMAMLA